MSDFDTMTKEPEVPIHQLFDPLFEKAEVAVFIKREDLIHPQVSGNKWRKLKLNIQSAAEQGAKTLITFGGAYSNHIYATAAAARLAGLKSVGIIRGEKVLPLNPTLQFATEQGMELHFVSREAYRNRKEEIAAEMLSQHQPAFLIPEGAANPEGVKGCEAITADLTGYDFAAVACGTGGTLAGMAAGNSQIQIIGFPVLKGDFLENDIKQLHQKTYGKALHNWQLVGNYHFGGYAKWTSELVEFIQKFRQQHQIQLDPIYTGKMMFGVYELIQKNYFPKASRILVIHTGGLQGIEGFEKRTGIQL